MTKCTASILEFPRCQRRRVQVEFSGGAITSDGGVVLLRQVDQRIGLTARLAQALPDSRDPVRCAHGLRDLLRQRIYGLALGYEDLNDHQTLRQDPAVPTAVDRDSPLASPATLCRWENRASRAVAWTLHEVLVEQFIASFSQPPAELILDFDATDDPVHGHHELSRTYPANPISCTGSVTVPEATWKTELKSNNSTCSPIAPVVMPGGRINFGYSCPVVPTG